MENKSIDLILKAKLEASEALTGAEDLGKKMAASFAGAFDTIGEQIAQKVLEAAKRTISGASLSSGSDFLTRNHGWASQIPNIGGQVSNSAPNTALISTATPAGGNSAGLVTAGNSAAAGDQRAAVSEQARMAQETATGRTLMYGGYGAGVRGFGGLLQLEQAKTLAGGPNFAQEHPEASSFAVQELLMANTTAEKASLYMRMKRAGVNVPADSYISERNLGIGIKAGEHALANSGDELRRLIEQIEDLNKKFEEANGNADKQADIQKDLTKAIAEKNNIETHQQAAVRDINTMRAMQNEAYAMPETSKGIFGSQQGRVRAISAIGFGAQVLADAPGLYRQTSAMMARYGNLESRAMASGDIDRLLAVQALGGQESVNTAGVLEGGAKSVIGAGVSGFLGYMGGTAAAGALSLGPAGVLGLGVAGAGMAAYNALSSTPARIGNSIEDQIQTQLGVNQEYYDMNRAGRNTAIGAYRGAQSMGAPELSRFLIGGQDASIYDQQAARVSARIAGTEDRMRRVIEYAGPQAAGGSKYRGYEQSISADKAEIERLNGESASARRMMVPGLDGSPTSLRQYSANFMSGQAYDTMMGTLAGRMGGVFAGEAHPRLEDASGGIKALIEAQGNGLSNAADIAGGLFMGGMGRETSMTRTKEIFEDAVSAGLDKARVGQALQVMATQAASGLGAATGAQADFNRSMGVAQKLFGDKVEGQEMDFVQRAMQQNRDLTRSSGGIGAVAGMVGAMGVESQLKKELGKDFKGFGLTGLLDAQKFSGTFNDDATTKFLKDRGVDTDKLGPMQITKITSLLNQSSPKGLATTMDLLGSEGESAFHATSGSSRTITEKQEMASLVRADASGLGPKKVADFKADEVPSVAGADEARAFDKAEADKIVKGVVTLGNTIGSLKDALDGVIRRANEVLNKSPIGPSGGARPHR